MDADAKENLDISFAAVPATVIRKPNINTIYFNMKLA